MRLHHHLHLRKRLSKGLEPFPARSRALRMLDRTVFAVGALGPLFTIPQVYKIYATQSANDLSPISWAAWALFDIPWILYGLAHREKPIVSTYILWFVCNGMVFIGAILYG